MNDNSRPSSHVENANFIDPVLNYENNRETYDSRSVTAYPIYARCFPVMTL